MIEIHKTEDYSFFSFVKGNRPLRNTKKLEKSILELDLTMYNPIMVDEDYNIIDGQHRFIACKRLGKPIYYVVMEEEDAKKAMMLLNINLRAWKQEEYLNFYANEIGGCYKDLQDFDNTHKLGISNSIVIYCDKLINATILKSGKANFGKNVNADAIAEFLKDESIKWLRYSRTRPFVLAVRKAFETYNGKQINKLKSKMLSVPMCANFEQYLTCFENILKIK